MEEIYQDVLEECRRLAKNTGTELEPGLEGTVTGTVVERGQFRLLALHDFLAQVNDGLETKSRSK